METQSNSTFEYRSSSASSSGPELTIYRSKDQGDCRPAVDYKQRTADKSATGGWKPALLIYGTELCERIAGFGVTQTLVTYLTSFMHLDLDFSANVVTTFAGASYMSFIIGGLIADAWLGRFFTLILAILIQFFGLVLLTFTATYPALKPPPCTEANVSRGRCKEADGWTLAVLFMGLCFVALGIGSIKSCVSAFGADQFDISDPFEKTRLPRFFNWFFFVVSLGGLVAVTALVYIQQDVGRGWGFGTPAVVMLCSLFLLICGRKKYRYKMPTGSPMTHAVQVMVAAFRNRNLPHPSTEEFQRNVFLYIDDPQAYVQHYNKDRSNFLFRFLDKATIVKVESGPKQVGDWQVASLEKVEEVKRIFHLIPTMATSFLYYTVLAQMLTFSVGQSETLNRKLGPSFVVPPAAVGVFLHLTVLVVIPLYEVIVKPVLSHLTSHETGISMLQRIGVGLVLSVLSMITAALVERRRLGIVAALHLEDHPGVMMPMSVFWLVPQYFLVGLGEVCAYIGHMEFFYTEAPKTMRTIGTGFFLFTLAMGYFASSLIVYLVGSFSTRWLNSTNINTGRLDKFFWLMAGIAGVNVVLYVVVSRNYTYTNELYTRELNSKRWKLLEHSMRRWSAWASSPMRAAPTDENHKLGYASPVDLELQQQKREDEPSAVVVLLVDGCDSSPPTNRQEEVTTVVVDPTRQEVCSVELGIDGHDREPQQQHPEEPTPSHNTERGIRER